MLFERVNAMAVHDARNFKSDRHAHEIGGSRLVVSVECGLWASLSGICVLSIAYATYMIALFNEHELHRSNIYGEIQPEDTA